MASFGETLGIVAEMSVLDDEEEKLFTAVAKGEVALVKTASTENPVAQDIRSTCEHALSEMRQQAHGNPRIVAALQALHDLLDPR